MTGPQRVLLFLAYEQALNQMGPRSERWHRHLYSMKHALQRVTASGSGDREQSNDPVGISVQQRLRNWISVCRMTAETCGRGFPLADWETQPGQASHITCHDHDSLLYAAEPTAGVTVLSPAVELNVAGATNATFVSGNGGLRMTTARNDRRVSTVLSSTRNSCTSCTQKRTPRNTRVIRRLRKRTFWWLRFNGAWGNQHTRWCRLRIRGPFRTDQRLC